VGAPRNWKKAILGIPESGGAMIRVSDPEILEARRNTGRLTGIFAEPAAAAAVAGVRRAVREGIIGRRASVLA
jgi:threonine synthase